MRLEESLGFVPEPTDRKNVAFTSHQGPHSTCTVPETIDTA